MSPDSSTTSRQRSLEPHLGDICTKDLLISSGSRSQQNLSMFAFVCIDAVLDVIIQSWQFRRGGIPFSEVISVLSSHPISLLVQVPRGVCVVQ